MRNLLLSFIIISLSLFAFSGQDSKKVALVKVMRGKAKVLSLSGDDHSLKKGMWIKEGSIIKTEGRSFVRLSFIDKSTMNIGPKSEIKIEKFNKKEAGVINVLTGKIRSQVTKNYLEMEKGKSKLFIKSKSAVMGIRGTDFLFSANKKNGATTAVLFEGSVVFSKLKKGDNQRDLEKVVNSGRRIKPGEFSVVMKNVKKATVPSKMSSKQFKILLKNETFKVADIKNKKKKTRSIVPPGLTGEVVVSDKKFSSAGENTIAQGKPALKQVVMTAESKGFIKGEDVKPVDGAVVHIDTGTIIPLGMDSKFDKTKGEWVSHSIGDVDVSGEYLPPEGIKITDDGKLIKEDRNGIIKEIVNRIAPIDEVKPLDQHESIIIDQNHQDPNRVPGGEAEPRDGGQDHIENGGTQLDFYKAPAGTSGTQSTATQGIGGPHHPATNTNNTNGGRTRVNIGIE